MPPGYAADLITIPNPRVTSLKKDLDAEQSSIFFFADSLLDFFSVQLCLKKLLQNSVPRFEKKYFLVRN